jgi:DNA-binding LytR/AlgR family response regulator
MSRSNLLHVAVLEDSPILLKELVAKIDELKLAKVIFKSQNSIDFINKMDENKNDIQALILDIDLSGDSMNGIDISNRYDLPVLFITGKTRDYIERIEESKLSKKHPVEFLTKPSSDERLMTIFEKFKTQIEAFKTKDNIELKFVNGFREVVAQSDIILIESDPNSTTNDKLVYLKSSEYPKKVSKVSLDYFFDKGLSKDKFTKTHQSFLINNDYFNDYKKGEDSYSFSFVAGGIRQTKTILISKENQYKRK